MLSFFFFFFLPFASSLPRHDADTAESDPSCAVALLAGSRQRAPLALGDAPWLDAGWLRGGENCEQSRLSHLFGAGVAWIDVGVGEVLSALHRSSLVVLTSDHGASWLGKGSPYEAGRRVRVPHVRSHAHAPGPFH